MEITTYHNLYTMKIYNYLLFCIAALLMSVLPLRAQKTINVQPIEKNFADTINIEFFMDWPIVPATVNGIPMRFVFDTGASYTIIDPKVMPEGGRTMESGIINDSNDIDGEMKFTELCGFTLGKLNFPCHRALLFSFDGNPMFRCARIDGFIGGNILQSMSFKIDKQKKQLIVTDRKKWFQIDKKKENDIKIEGVNRPYINIFVGEVKEENVLLDTGSNGFYSLADGAFKQLRTIDPSVWKGEVIETVQGAARFSAFGFAQTDSIYLLKLPEWSINGFLFKNMATATAHSGHSIVGSKLLDYGQIVLDYPRKKFAFLPYDNAESITLDDEEAEEKFSIGVDENGHIILGLLYENSELYRQGARQGDRLIELNGQKLNDDLCLFISIGEEEEIKEIKVLDKEGNEKVFLKNHSETKDVSH